MYSLRLNRAANRVELSFTGHMVQNAEAFFIELTNAALSVRSYERDWDLLVDYSQTPVLPQDRAQNTARVFEWCVAHGIHRIAIVSRSATQTMQLRRVSQRNPLVQVFDQVSTAADWLNRGTVS